MAIFLFFFQEYIFSASNFEEHWILEIASQKLQVFNCCFCIHFLMGSCGWRRSYWPQFTAGFSKAATRPDPVPVFLPFSSPSPVCIFVSLGGHTEMAQAGWFRQQTFISHSSGHWKSQVRGHRGWVLVTAFLLAGG